MLISVLDHLDTNGAPDLQAALDAATDGDAVYMPGWFEYLAPTGGFRVKSSIELFGDGPGDPAAGTGTLLRPAATSEPVLVIDGSAGGVGGLPNLRLRDFRIAGTWTLETSATDTGHGIHVTSESNMKVSETSFERIHVSGVSGSAFALEGLSGGDAAVVGIRLLDCVGEDCGGRGMLLRHVSQALVMHCRLKGNGGAGVRGESSGVALCQCTVDGNDALLAEANISLLLCYLARVDACRIVNFGLGAATGCRFDRCGGAGSVGNCFFEVASYGGTSIEIVEGLDNPDVGPILVMPNRHRRVQTLARVGTEAVGCVVMPQFDDPAGGGMGTMELPGAPNAGLVAVPSINRPSGNAVAGIVLPSRFPDGDPTLNLQDGTLAYSHDEVSPQVRGWVAGVKKDVILALARIADLLIDAQGRHSLRLRWTSLGGTLYDLRRSTTAILTDEDFRGATRLFPQPPAPQPITPGPIGSYECWADLGDGGADPLPCTTYYYAIKYFHGDWSPMSNVAVNMTLCQGFFEVECP